MKLNVEPLEVVVFILFLLYLIMQVKTPEMLKPLINDPVGMVVIILGILYLLYYTHPILGILGIFVAYELINDKGIISSKQFIELNKYFRVSNNIIQKSLNNDILEKYLLNLLLWNPQILNHLFLN